MTRKASPADIDHAIQLYLGGNSCQVAARGITGEKRLREILEAKGLWRTPAERKALAAAKISAAGRIALPDADIAAAYLAGESEQAIAARFGVSRNVIRLRLKSEGVAIRSMSDASLLSAIRSSPDERARRVAAAHDAVRGSTRSLESLCTAASTREKRGRYDSAHEVAMSGLLEARGIACTPQQAIGPYNCDIGAAPVAVEIHGGKWHGYGRHADRAADRTRYILDHGWNLVIVWVHDARQAPSVAAADYIARFVELSRADPSMRGEYRVIRGDGKMVSAGEYDIDDLSCVPSSR